MRISRRLSLVIVGATAVAIAAIAMARTQQAPAIRALNEDTLREYAGVYRWDAPEGFVYLQLWNELGGTNQLVAFDESGELRTLYGTDTDRFFAGPGAAVPTPIESRVMFQRDTGGHIAALTWQREGEQTRTARRVDNERSDDVSFTSGDIRLAGRLISPARPGKHPAVILVHGSGPATREGMLPFARFLVRRGMAVFGYDKRGAGASTGDWKTASFDDLAADVVSAFRYLTTRPDVDATQIGVLGVSQAGWVMPLAALRVPELAFLISVSGAGVPAAETTIDHARREMAASGMTPDAIELVVELMQKQYAYARDGRGWDAYLAARGQVSARLGGSPPETFPGTPDDPYWDFIRRLYFYDPAPTLRRLRTPTLGLFGQLDDNILPEKNRVAWESAVTTGGHPDVTLRVLPKANHDMLEATVGNNAEMPSLRRFVPEYAATLNEWLEKRIRGFGDNERR